MKCEDIIQRYRSLQSQRKTIEIDYEKIETYVTNFRGEFFTDLYSEHQQQGVRREHHDSTAVYAAKTLKSHIHGMLVSPASKWFGTRYRQDDMNDDHEAKIWLEDTEDRAYQALIQSKFNIMSAEFLYDMVTYGMGFGCEEVDDSLDFEVIDFTAVSIRDGYFETNHKDELKIFYRRYMWTPLQCIAKFGDDCPEDIVARAESASSVDTKEEIVYCVYEREKWNRNAEETPPKQRRYGKKYVRASNSKRIGDEGGFYEMPFFYAIWDSTTGSKLGNSPAMTCMADIERLNVLVKAEREQAGMALAPPILTEDRNVIGDINLKKRGVTVARNIDKVRELITGARFDVGDNTIRDLRMSIERAFLMDSLQLKESPAMTATEVQARYDLMMRSISHTLGSLQSNFLDKVIQRTINILHRADKLMPTPDSLRESDGDIDISYTGPMARAQKNDDVMSTRQWIQGDIPAIATVMVESGLPATIMDIPDWDAIGRDLGDLAGVPAKYMLSQDDVDKLRAQRAAKQEEAEKMMKLQQAGAAMKSVGDGSKSIEETEGGAQAMQALA